MAGYRKPGATVSITSERVNPGLISGDETLLIIGENSNFPSTFNDTVRLGDEAVELSREGVDDTSIVVVERDNPLTTLVEDTDYSVSQTTDSSNLTTTTLSRVFSTVTDEAKQWTAAGETVDLDNANISPGSVTVTWDDAGTPTDLVEGDDYYVDYELGRVTHMSDSDTVGTFPADLTIDYDWSTVDRNTALIVSYDYTPTDLNDVKTWSNINDIVTFYGPAFSGDTIYSDISLAVQIMGTGLAGASLPTIKTLLVAPDLGDGDAGSVGSDDYVAALNDQVSSHSDVTHILLLTSDSQTWTSFSQYLTNMENDNSTYIRGFLGPESGFDILSRATGSTSIVGLGSKRVQVVSPEQIPYTNLSTGNRVHIPGYFGAAALMGYEATRDKFVSMTNKILPQFNEFRGNQLLTESQKNRLATSGITVLENNNEGQLKVRHSLTTSLANPENQEPSVVRTLDFLARDFKQSFDNALETGDYYADDITMLSFQSSTEQRLLIRSQEGTIRDWESVEVEIDPSDQRRFIVRGRINPRFPLNGVDFHFTIP